MAAGPKVARKDLKEDKVYLTMAEVVELVVRHRLAIGLAALAALAAVAMAYYMSVRAGQRSTAASWALYQTTYIEDAAEKIVGLEKVATEYRRTQAAVFAQFELANTLYAQSKYEEALEAFQKFLKNNSRHFLAPSATEAVGYCQESLGQWNEAIQTYTTMIEKDPTGPMVARSTYRLGHCYEKIEDEDKAIEYYANVSELAPESLWADYARQRLESLRPEEYASQGPRRPLPSPLGRPFMPPPPPPAE